MGRESRFMLALLGLLAGVFVAALSLKLFVPRPPRGTGPDIHMTSSTAGTAIVPPPDLSPSPAAAAPWAVPPDDATPAPSRFAAPEEPSPSPWASPTEGEQSTSAPLTVLPSDEAPALAAIPSEAFPSTADETDRPLATASAATLVSNQVAATTEATTAPWQPQARLRLRSGCHCWHPRPHKRRPRIFAVTCLSPGSRRHPHRPESTISGCPRATRGGISPNGLTVTVASTAVSLPGTEPLILGFLWLPAPFWKSRPPTGWNLPGPT
jgi:hypothetical protein